MSEQNQRIVRAMAAQEYFWYLQAADPESSSYVVELAIAVDGPLDRERLTRAVVATVAAHDIFRTAFREIDGRLFLVERAAPSFELAVEDLTAVPEAQHDAEIDRVAAALVQRLDLATGSTVQGRLLAFGPERHVLFLVIPHAVFDAGSIVPLEREIFRRYRESDAPVEPAAQYLDYADEFDRFTRTPAGQERRAWWQDTFRGARPIDLPFDFPAREVDARRDAVRFGIVPEPMYPWVSVAVPAELREGITRAATAWDVAPSVVYLAALLGLFQELSHQDDLCIETVHNPRADHRAEQIMGPLATWTMMRCDLSSSSTLREIALAAKAGMQAAFDHSLAPHQFSTIPAELRGTCFNYVPAAMAYRSIRSDGVTANLLTTRPAPRYKRHWRLMLLIFDSTRGGELNWTGNQNLWRRETIEELAQRYLRRLEQLA
jgi:hypothetical protein